MLHRIRKIAIDLMHASAAGICVSIGGAVYLSCPNKLLGSFLFSVGLCAILFFKLLLFTGRVGYLTANKPSYLPWLGLVWIGNCLGTWLGAFAQTYTRTGDKLIAAAKEIVAVKSGDSLISLFILSIFCGLMMYIAAEGTRRTPYGSTFQLSLVMLPVAVFIVCGFEHCIADVYYYALAGFSWDAILRILIITLGNSIGSILLHIGVSHHEPA